MGDVPIKKNVARVIFLPGLVSQADTKLLITGPTIAAGDFKYSQDGGAFTNLATLPDVYPTGTTQVRLQLSQSELNCDQLNVKWEDAAGEQWCSGALLILTAVNQTNDTPPNSSGTNTILTDYARRTGDYATPGNVAAIPTNPVLVTDPRLGNLDTTISSRSTLTASQVWAALTSGLVTPGSIGAWILDKLDVKVSSVSTGAIPTVAQIWNYAWRTLTTNHGQVVVNENTIQAYTYNTLSQPIEDLGPFTNYVALYITVKQYKKDIDAQAILKVMKRADGVGDGLLIAFGQPATAGDGSITISDASLGNIVWMVKDTIMSQIQIGEYFADVKIIRSAGVLSETLRNIKFVVTDTVTKAIS